MARKVDFRGLADDIRDINDLIRPDSQKDHPAMKELFEILAYNLMDDGERVVFDQDSPWENKPSAWETFHTFGTEVGGTNHSREDMLDTLFSGLMDDEQYRDFQQEKSRDSSLTAERYFDGYVLPYAGPGMRKLSSMFKVFLAEKPAAKPLPFLSKDEFMSMSSADRQKNHDRAMRSMKKW